MTFTRNLLGALAIASLGIAGSQAEPLPPGTGPNPELNYNMGVATHFVRKGNMRHHDPVKYMPMVAELGVGWIRDEIMWNQVEQEKGQYSIPELSTEWIDLANRHGLKIIVVFSGGNTRLYPDDPFAPDAYAKAVAFVAKELRGKIHALEIVNEPFGHYAAAYGQGTKKGGTWYGRDKDGSTSDWVKRYVVLLNKAAAAIKAVNPDIKVIGLGSAPQVNYQQIALGVSPNVDGITAHPYSYRTPPEIVPYPGTPANRKRDGFVVTDEAGTFSSLIEKYREWSAKHKGPREIWLTEWGYTTYLEGTARTNYSGFTEEAQAAYSQRRFLEGLGLGVDVSCQYVFLDKKHDTKGYDPRNSEHNFGLLRHDGTPRPVYHAVQRVAKSTLGFTPVSGADALGVKIQPFSDRTERHPVVWDGDELPAPNRIASYQFRDKDGRPVIALWSMERVRDLNPRAADIEIDISPDSKIEVLDLMTGDRYAPEAKAKHGRLTLPLFQVPTHPILLHVSVKK